MTTHSIQQPDNFLPEVVIGIVSPVGTNLAPTIAALKSEFEKKKFAFHHVKISSLFPDIAETLGYVGLDGTKKYARTDTYIKFGNFVRDSLGTKSLSVFAMTEIAARRNERKADGGGIAYVIDQ